MMRALGIAAVVYLALSLIWPLKPRSTIVVVPITSCPEPEADTIALERSWRI